MKIKLLPFNKAVKKSKECSEEHFTVPGERCIGFLKSDWKDNKILKVLQVREGGQYYSTEDGEVYCKCCCEVIEE